MAKTDNLTDFLTDLADGIRTIEGTTAKIDPQDFRGKIDTYVKPSTKKAAATITPSTSNQTIAAGTYLTGAQTISGDADLTAGNIKHGVNIFGVTGTFTSDATAVTADVLSGKVAYVKGLKLEGTMTDNGAVSRTLDTSTTTSYTVPAGYHNGSGTVSITTETKSATPSTSAQDITPSRGKVLSKVTVEAIPNQKTASDVTVSGATVSVPVGYYGTAVSKSVTTATRANTTATTTADDTADTLTVTASNNQTTG